MHSVLQTLLQLEEVDREIARLQAEIAALPVRVAQIEAQLAGVDADVERGSKALKDIEAARRKHEGDIQTERQKISKYRDQMLAVKTNHEYKALGNEISFAETAVRTIEDKILEGMMEAESRERDLKAAKAEQKKEQAEVELEKTRAHARTEEDEKRLAELMPQRESLRTQIESSLLDHYDRLRRQRGNAMAEAKDQRCLACFVQLRPQVYLDTMTTEQVLTCESCGRILYFNAAHASPAEGVSAEPKLTVESAAAEAPDLP
ncbi:MAG: C4-type zinc ribbon domain-containing protein [Terriglobales bacterium]|jgi:predicted  nucleic acid-binding Zn-ribbon protein